MFTETINGISVSVAYTDGLFSPGGLDRGTRAMLETYPANENDRVLDLGCGAGWVGIYASLVCGEKNAVLLDRDENAVKAAGKNAQLNGVNPLIVQSNGFFELTETGFTLIYSNPPYQSDFAVAKHFIEKGFNRLLIGGKMVMVTKRRAWYENKLRSIFGGVKAVEKDGYFVFISEKRRNTYAGAKTGNREKA